MMTTTPDETPAEPGGENPYPMDEPVAQDVVDLEAPR
jgi:hypothetical protein